MDYAFSLLTLNSSNKWKKYMNIHIDLFVVTVKKMNIYIEENTMVLTR
jgi:hypothetical protein